MTDKQKMTELTDAELDLVTGGGTGSDQGVGLPQTDGGATATGLPNNSKSSTSVANGFGHDGFL